MKTPTHAKLDELVHHVATVTPASYGSAHSHRVRMSCGIVFDVRGEHQFTEERWLEGSTATCDRCAATESGDVPPVSTPPAAGEHVRLADIPLGISCPMCGHEIRARRYDEGAACDNGHEYTIPEVEKVAASLLTRLAGGQLLPKKGA